MTRKVYVTTTVRLIAFIDDNMEVSDMMEDLEYYFLSGEGYDIIDTEIRDYEVTDSK